MLRWLERGLLLSGAGALIWCGAVVADLAIAQRRAHDALQVLPPPPQLLTPALEEPTVTPALEEAPSASAPARPRVDVGAAVATLAVPRIGLSAVVLHGSDATTLRRGPGHLERTAYPGQTGNTVIAGHRDTFFRPLRNIRVGDDIFLDAPTGRFHYRVTSLRVVGPRDISVLAPTRDATLTLITCYPFWLLGGAPDRFIVRASRVDSGAPAPAVAAAVPTDDTGLVRQAVARYLSIQGVRATVPCRVTLDGDRATAQCDPRTFALERAGAAWAIRSVVLK
jgi:sortase A